MRHLAGLAVLLVLVGASACVPRGSQNHDATPTTVGSNEIHEPTSLTSTPGILANATQQTHIKSTDTPSAQLLLSETEIPLAGSTIVDAIRPPDGCSLPCWMGVVPGVSSVADLRVALLGIAEDSAALDDDMASYETAILLPGTAPELRASRLGGAPSRCLGCGPPPRPHPAR